MSETEVETAPHMVACKISYCWNEEMQAFDVYMQIGNIRRMETVLAICKRMEEWIKQNMKNANLSRVQ